MGALWKKLLLLTIDLFLLPWEGVGLDAADCESLTVPLGQVPVLYINLKRSTERNIMIRCRVEQSASWLERVAAVDATHPKEVIKHAAGLDCPAEIQDRLCVDAYGKSITARPGELALSLSHLKAMKRGHELTTGNSVLVIEDDVYPVLPSFWPDTMDELVARLDRERPEWEVLRLQYHHATGPTWFRRMNSFRKRPTEMFEGGKGSKYGLAAYLLNEQGLNRTVDRHVAEDGRLNCTDYCVADIFFPRTFKGSQLLAPTQPLFTVSYFESYTGVRSSNVTMQESPKAGRHEQSAADSFLLSYLRISYRIAEAFYGGSPQVEGPLYRWRLTPTEPDLVSKGK